MSGPCGFQRAESLVETTMSGQDHRALRPLACFVEVACFALTAHVADAQALAVSLVTSINVTVGLARTLVALECDIRSDGGLQWPKKFGRQVAQRVDFTVALMGWIKAQRLFASY